MGRDSGKEFCQWLFSEENEGAIAMAHNAKGVDSDFLLHYLHESGVKRNVVKRGLKIMQLEACGVRIIDFMNFVPVPLDELPKAFGFG